MALGKKTGGRQAGTPNKTTALLKDAILEAAAKAGGKGELVGYLTTQARENPTAFLTLLGKVLPMTVQGDPENPIKFQHDIAPADRIKEMVNSIAERSGEAGSLTAH